MQTSATRYIEVTKETRGKLTRVFNCTEKMVADALTYRRSTELARKIRFTAIRNYGGVPMCQVPECKTWFDVTEDGRDLMRQKFDNGAMLEADKGTGEVIVKDRRGDVVQKWEHVTIPELYEIQQVAADL